MKFRIPEKVTIGGVDFNITWQKGLGRNAAKRGETQYFDREIRLDPDLVEQDKEQTFIHEITHAVDSVFDCHLSESQAKRMAHGVYQVLRQLKEE